MKHDYTSQDSRGKIVRNNKQHCITLNVNIIICLKTTNEYYYLATRIL